jgi:trimethylamine:corrinoid methyltransferase-like protein
MKEGNEMPEFEIGFEPKLTFLSDADKQKIYQASLRVIEETGMQASYEAGLETFMSVFAGSNLNHDVGSILASRAAWT